MNHTTLSIVHLSTSPVVSNLVSIQATSPHPVLPWTHPSHRSIQCSLELSKPPIHSSAPLDSTKPPVHLNAPLDYPSHRFTPVLPWTHSSHWSILVLPWTIQATGSLQLELFYSIAHVCNVVFTSVLIH
jgi:hypothetical protein